MSQIREDIEGGGLETDGTYKYQNTYHHPQRMNEVTNKEYIYHLAIDLNMVWFICYLRNMGLSSEIIVSSLQYISATWFDW